MIEQQDLIVTTLGECQVTSPLDIDTTSSSTKSHLVSDSMRIRFNVEVGAQPIYSCPHSRGRFTKKANRHHRRSLARGNARHSSTSQITAPLASVWRIS